jgi:hypothetical protein
MNLIEESLRSVVKTIRNYEKNFSSVKRTPLDRVIGVNSLSTFIECRINFECFKIPELREYEELMDGYLRTVSEITGEDGRHFDWCTIALNEKPDHLDEITYQSIIQDVMNLVGGNELKFTSNHRKLNLTIIA